MNWGIFIFMGQKITNVNLEIPNLSPQMYLEIQCNPNKNPSRFFSCVEITKWILKCILKSKLPRITKVILKKNKVEELSLLNIKPYCKTSIVQTMKLVRRSTNRPINKIRDFRNRLTHWTDLWQGRVEKGQCVQ